MFRSGFSLQILEDDIPRAEERRAVRDKVRRIETDLECRRGDGISDPPPLPGLHVVHPSVVAIPMLLDILPPLLFGCVGEPPATSDEPSSHRLEL